MASRKTNASKHGPFDNLISTCDFYGAKPELTYKGKKSLSSGFGGFVSFVVFISGAVCSTFIAWRYYQRASSETNVDKVHVPNPVGFTLTKENLPFAFGMQRSTGEHFIDDTVYTTELKYVRVQKNIINGELVVDSKTTKLDLIPCSEAKLDPNMFDNLPLNHMNCIKEFINPTTKLEITGEWESDTFGFIQFFIKRCKGSQCKTDIEINEILKVSYFAVNYVNYATRSSNYSDPVYRYPTSFFTTTSTDFTKEIGMRLSDNEINTHSSLFGYFQPETVKFTNTDFFTSDIVAVGVDQLPETLIYMRLRMGRMKTVTTRVYETAFEAFAELGGVISVITIAALLTSIRVTNTYLLLDLISARNTKTQNIKQTGSTSTEKQSELAAGSKRFDKEMNLVINSNKHIEGGVDFLDEYTGNAVMMPSGFAYINPPKDTINLRKKKGLILKKKPVPISHKVSAQEPLGFDQHKLQEGGKSNKISPFSFQSAAPQPVLGFDQINREDPLKLIELSADKNLHKTLTIKKPISERNKKISTFSIFAYAYLPFLVSKKSPVVQAINEAEKTVVKELDFMRFLKLISDIEKLKHLLLTPEQLILFDKVELDELVEIKRNAGNKDYEFVSDEIEEEAACEQRTNRNIKKALIYISNKQPEALSDVDRIMMYSLGFHLEDQDAAMLEHNV
jgi:hypothetical protein